MNPNDAASYIDLSFKLFEIASIIAGFAVGLREMGKSAAKTDEALKQQNKVMGDMKDDIKALNKIVTEVAVQNNRLDLVEKRFDRMEHQIDDLRRGVGWVTGPKGH